MNTGVTSFSKLTEMTTLYPFQGTEIAFTFAVLAFFLSFIVYQVLMESKHHKAIIGNFTASPAE